MQTHDTFVAVEHSVREVLETMCFTEVLGPATAPIAGPTLGASLEFLGPYGGSLALSVTKPLAHRMAVDFLGESDPAVVGPEATGQVVCELANMICGSLLNRLSREAVFDLSQPQIDVDPADATCDLCGVFDTGDGTVTVRLILGHSCLSEAGPSSRKSHPRR